MSAFEEVRPGVSIVREGNIGTSIFVVVEGRVKIEIGRGSSEPLLLEVLGSGEVSGKLSLLAQRPRSADVIALETTTLLRIDHRDLRAAIVRNPTLALALLETPARRIIVFGELVRFFAAADLESRIARRVSAWAEVHGVRRAQDVVLDLGLTQREWAHVAGTSRESVSRLVRSWSERDWISRREGRLEIHDRDSTREVAANAGLRPDT